MNILLINHYGNSPTLNRSMRTFELAKFLTRFGNHVEFVIGGNNPYLLTDLQLYKGCRKWDEEGVAMLLLGLLYHSPKNKLFRLFGWFQFAIKILLLPSKLTEKPDVIVYSSLSLPGVLSSLVLAKYYGARHVFEVRDIWPLTMQKLLNLRNFHPLVMLLSAIEWAGYRYSDMLITSMPGGYEWIQRKMGPKYENTFWLPNGVDLSRFGESARASMSTENVKVIYLGTIGLANSVITLLEAAVFLADNKNVSFEIYGDGQELQNLKDYKEERKLGNVHFLGSVDQTHVPEILYSADILFHGSNDSELYKFGISPNKLAEYMAAGRPIVNSYSGGFDPISAAKCGITSRAGDGKALASSILKLANDPRFRAELGARGRKVADEQYSYAAVNTSYYELLKQL